MEYFLAATCSGKSEAERVAIFMCMIGKDGQEVKDTFEFERAEDGIRDYYASRGLGDVYKIQNFIQNETCFKGVKLMDFLIHSREEEDHLVHQENVVHL